MPSESAVLFLVVLLTVVSVACGYALLAPVRRWPLLLLMAAWFMLLHYMIPAR